MDDITREFQRRYGPDCHAFEPMKWFSEGWMYALEQEQCQHCLQRHFKEPQNTKSTMKTLGQAAYEQAYNRVPMSDWIVLPEDEKQRWETISAAVMAQYFANADRVPVDPGDGWEIFIPAHDEILNGCEAKRPGSTLWEPVPEGYRCGALPPDLTYRRKRPAIDPGQGYELIDESQACQGSEWTYPGEGENRWRPFGHKPGSPGPIIWRRKKKQEIDPGQGFRLIQHSEARKGDEWTMQWQPLEWRTFESLGAADPSNIAWRRTTEPMACWGCGNTVRIIYDGGIHAECSNGCWKGRSFPSFNDAVDWANWLALNMPKRTP